MTPVLSLGHPRGGPGLVVSSSATETVRGQKRNAVGTIHYETEGKSHRACVPTATPFRGQALTFPGRLAARQTRDLVLVNRIPTVKLGETKGVMGVLWGTTCFWRQQNPES